MRKSVVNHIPLCFSMAALAVALLALFVVSEQRSRDVASGSSEKWSCTLDRPERLSPSAMSMGKVLVSELEDRIGTIEISAFPVDGVPFDTFENLTRIIIWCKPLDDLENEWHIYREVWIRHSTMIDHPFWLPKIRLSYYNNSERDIIVSSMLTFEKTIE